MKQKYEIAVNKDENKITVREFAQLDKEVMSLLCQENFDLETVKQAIAADNSDALYAALRSNNMYPPAIYMEGITAKIKAMLSEDVDGPEEVIFDDLEFLSTYIIADLEKDIVSLGKDDDSLDALLDPEGFDEVEFEEKDNLDKISDTLKVDDSEYSDIDADV